MQQGVAPAPRVDRRVDRLGRSLHRRDRPGRRMGGRGVAAAGAAGVQRGRRQLRRRRLERELVMARHPRWVRGFLAEADLDAVTQAIGVAELRTSAEIRVHLDHRCPGEPMARAVAVFEHPREAVKSLIVRESLNQTLILIFEDLHWVDAESEALLQLVADSIGTAQILMMVNYRPEYRHNWGNKTYYTQLRLDPLGPDNAAELLTAMIGDASALAPLKATIIERTQGNPFFIEEMVQVLFDQGVLVRDGEVSIAKPLTSIAIPSTVKGILAARIDKLAPADKDLLAIARGDRQGISDRPGAPRGRQTR